MPLSLQGTERDKQEAHSGFGRPDPQGQTRGGKLLRFFATSADINVSAFDLPPISAGGGSDQEAGEADPEAAGGAAAHRRRTAAGELPNVTLYTSSGK